MLGKLLTFFAIGLLSLIGIGIALAVIGVAFSIALGVGTFLLFKVAPIVFIGWIVLKFLDRRKPRNSLTDADREWLESGG
jgi:ABC-type polysaccharide/polyol phosphate export permease